MFSKLTIKTPEQLQSRCSGILFVNFELISHLFLVFLFLSLNKLMLSGRKMWLTYIFNSFIVTTIHYTYLFTSLQRNQQKTFDIWGTQLHSFSVNYYHKVLHLGCCSSPRSVTEIWHKCMQLCPSNIKCLLLVSLIDLKLCWN